MRPGRLRLEPLLLDLEVLRDLGFPVGASLAQPRAWRGSVRGIEDDKLWLLLAEIPSGRTIEASVRQSDAVEQLWQDAPVLVLTWKEITLGQWCDRRKVIRDDGQR